jgi:hypothetical protein
MPLQSIYSGQGPRVTVNDLIVDPLLIQQRFLQMADQQFIMEAILRQLPSAQSGIIGYHESTPLFLDDDAAVVGEGGEIPLGVGSDGIPKATHTIKLARGIEITREMRDRNRIDLVNVRMNQVRNTMVRTWENRLFSALSGATTGSVTAASPWQTSTTIRQDIMGAIQNVTEAKLSQGNNNTQNFLGFIPDIMVISTKTQYDMIGNGDFGQLYLGGDIAEKNPQYTGQLERTVQSMTVLISRFMPQNQVWLMESKTVGGFSDERPLGVTPLYADQPREVWRADVVRRTGIAIDQPLSACVINGV